MKKKTLTIKLLKGYEQCHACKKWFPGPLDNLTQDEKGNTYLTCEKCINDGWQALQERDIREVFEVSEEHK